MTVQCKLLRKLRVFLFKLHLGLCNYNKQNPRITVTFNNAGVPPYYICRGIIRLMTNHSS